jgi:DUF4097 and DUF4098 domain-containing protein YvlB
MRKLGILGIAGALVAGAAGPAVGGVNETWELTGVAVIELAGSSGDIVVVPVTGTTGRVELNGDVDPTSAFRAEVERDGDTLRLEEKWNGHSSHRSVTWTIYLADQADPPTIRVKTASGDLECSGVQARLDFDTASGDVDLDRVTLVARSRFDTASGDYRLRGMDLPENCEFSTASGDFELSDLTVGRGCEFSTASGDIECRSCTGELELSTASGDVDVSDCELVGHSRFSSASGEVEVELHALPAEGLQASSASGDVSFRADDFGDDFTLVLVKRVDRGSIRCPFRFTREEKFEENGQEYERKVVERGSGGPEVMLRTATGSVRVED